EAAPALHPDTRSTLVRLCSSCSTPGGRRARLRRFDAPRQRQRGAVDQALHRRLARREREGDLLVGHSLKAAHGECRAFPLAHLGQRAAHRVLQLSSLQRVLRTSLALGQLVQRGPAGALALRRRLVLSAANLVQAGIGGYPEEERLELGAGSVALRVSIQLDENLLRQLFRPRLASYEPEREPGHAGLVAVEDLRKRRLI